MGSDVVSQTCGNTWTAGLDRVIQRAGLLRMCQRAYSMQCRQPLALHKHRIESESLLTSSSYRTTTRGHYHTKLHRTTIITTAQDSRRKTILRHLHRFPASIMLPKAVLISLLLPLLFGSGTCARSRDVRCRQPQEGDERCGSTLSRRTTAVVSLNRDSSFPRARHSQGGVRGPSSSAIDGWLAARVPALCR